MSRLGIELSSSQCRLVDVANAGRARQGGGARVRAFASIAFDDPDTLTRQLRALAAKRGLSRRAGVTVWGLRSAHRTLLLPPAPPRELAAAAERDVRRDTPLLQIDGGAFTYATAVGREREMPPGERRQEAFVAAAASDDVRRAIQPVIDAGFDVDVVLTPPLALRAIAELRPAAAPDAANAYLAVNRDGVALAIVRDGLLVFAREMPWGYAALDPGELVPRLASELRRSFLFFRQTFKTAVAQVVVCGELPNLRSMTAPLISALDIEVETLDSLEGIDVASPPAPADAFRDQVASLRLAWATAAGTSAPINLLPAPIRQARAARRGRVAAAGAAAAAVAACALLYAQADASARAHEAERRRAAQELAAAEPRVRAARQILDDRSLDGARLAALESLGSAAPRLARVLEAIARSAPDDVTLQALKVSPRGASWRATIEGAAAAPDPARGQAAVARFVQALQASPYFGAPVRSPSLRVTTGERRAVEFAIDVDVPR